MIVDASEREFYLRASGLEIADLPDVPIFAYPMVKTSLHGFATSTPPGPWELRVKHHQFRGHKKQPKYLIQATTGRKSLAFMFRLPARSIYRDIADVEKDLLANMNGIFLDYARISAGGANIAKPDELDLLVEMNQRRAERLQSMPPIRTMRGHNQWASTEHAMNQAMARVERAGEKQWV